MSTKRSHLLNPFGSPTARQLLDVIREIRHDTHPRDLGDLTVVMHPETWYDIQTARDFPSPPLLGPSPSLAPIGPTLEPVPGPRFGGVTIHLWEAIQPGYAEITIENAQERALRRMARDGHTINVVKAERFNPSDFPPPPPAPTVRSLLAHWRKRVRKALTRG